MPIELAYAFYAILGLFVLYKGAPLLVEWLFFFLGGPVSFEQANRSEPTNQLCALVLLIVGGMFLVDFGVEAWKVIEAGK
jgi:hypothetical protein